MRNLVYLFFLLSFVNCQSQDKTTKERITYHHKFGPDNKMTGAKETAFEKNKEIIENVSKTKIEIPSEIKNTLLMDCKSEKCSSEFAIYQTNLKDINSFYFITKYLNNNDELIIIVTFGIYNDYSYDYNQFISEQGNVLFFDNIKIISVEQNDKNEIELIYSNDVVILLNKSKTVVSEIEKLTFNITDNIIRITEISRYND